MPFALLTLERRRLAAAAFFLLGAVLMAPPAAHAALSLDAALKTRVGEARQNAPELGVSIVDVESGEEVYAYRADTPRILASNTKLFTSAAALDLLGADFEFETPVLVRGAVYDGILDGDLAVVGGGDPNLSGRLHGGDIYAVFRGWAEVLKKRGVRQVAGDLYLVHGLFSDGFVHPDWPEEQLARWYEAPVAALSFNDSCVLVRVRPGDRAGAPATVELVPDLGLFRVVSQVSTTASRRRHYVVVQREAGSSEIQVRGSVYLGGDPAEAWVTVPDPVAYFGAALRAALAEEGITLHGRTIPASTLPGAVWERVYTERTDLLTTLTVLNHRSQNFYAESVLKVLGARLGQGGSWSQSLPVVEAFLRRAGLDEGFELADGSGMSRGNRASPRQMVDLLRFMYFHARGKEFLGTLPYSGSEDANGWRRRLAEGPYRGNVFAKTGTLSGISALSGYAKGTSGRLYAFSILCNRVGAVWRARRAQDAILRALIDHG